MEWKDQYKHPLWQKKRLEALEDAGYTCQACGDTETQLHVHHKRYVKGRKIWEYELTELAVLCGPCHESHHYVKDGIGEVFALVPSERHVELLQIIRGYTNVAIGPYFEGPYVRHIDQYFYLLGKIVAGMSHLERRNGPIAAAVATELRKSVPLATALHDDIDAAAKWISEFNPEMPE